jgi:transposase-like protein
MMKCPYCEAEEKQVKAGKNGSGSQRMKCQACGRRYTPEPSEHGYPEALRQQAVKLYVDGMNFRRIARHLGVHHKTVMLWVTARAEQLPDPPLPAQNDIIEQDELFTFMRAKKTKSMS